MREAGDSGRFGRLPRQGAYGGTGEKKVIFVLDGFFGFPVYVTHEGAIGFLFHCVNGVATINRSMGITKERDTKVVAV